jgi:hypothetical protein
MESLNLPRPKEVRQVRSKVKSMLIIFFDIKGIVHNEFVLADHIVNSTYYCDISWRLRENVRRLCPELWQQNNFLSHQGVFPPKQYDCHPPINPAFLFHQFKIKLKGHHFEVIEARQHQSWKLWLALCIIHEIVNVYRGRPTCM